MRVIGLGSTKQTTKTRFSAVIVLKTPLLLRKIREETRLKTKKLRYWSLLEISRLNLPKRKKNRKRKTTKM